MSVRYAVNRYVVFKSLRESHNMAFKHNFIILRRRLLAVPPFTLVKNDERQNLHQELLPLWQASTGQIKCPNVISRQNAVQRGQTDAGS